VWHVSVDGRSVGRRICTQLPAGQQASESSPADASSRLTSCFVADVELPAGEQASESSPADASPRLTFCFIRLDFIADVGFAQRRNKLCCLQL